uniref:Uncharacterized protein n=1 Tax=termite gut metagenome TaxID=433724 RepID=S0DEC3_9ZZZZ
MLTKQPQHRWEAPTPTRGRHLAQGGIHKHHSLLNFIGRDIHTGFSIRHRSYKAILHAYII